MTDLSLYDAVAQYLDALRRAGASDGTVKQYRSILFRLVRRYPNRRYKSIKVRDVDDFLYGPNGICPGKAPATQSSYRAALRGLFAHGNRLDWSNRPTVVPEPVIRVRTGPMRRHALPTRLSVPQLQLMLSRTEDAVTHGMLAVAINTALRISDVSKIRLGHLDFQNSEIHVLIKKTGEYDAFPMTRDLERELREYLTWYTRETGVTLSQADAYLFPGWERSGTTSDGIPTYRISAQRHVQYDWANKRLRQLYTACGLDVEGREAWHVIRRSVARIYFDMLRESVSHDHALRETAALLRHKQTVTTEQYLGMQAEIEARNSSLRGKSFIPSRPDSAIAAIYPRPKESRS